MREIQKYEFAIKSIQKIKEQFDKMSLKFPRQDMVGILGEYLVVKKLNSRGFYPQLKGGQGGYDISLTKNKKIIKIEVRTSLLKTEGMYKKKGTKKYIPFFGWRIQDRGKKIKYDYLICVTLNGSFKKAKYFVFTKKEVKQAENIKIKRFKTIKKSVRLFNSIKDLNEAKKIDPQMVTRFDCSFNKSLSKFKDKWDKLN